MNAPGPQPLGVTLLKRLLDEGFADGRVAIADEVCAPGLIEHQFGLEAVGAEALEGLRRAMTEVHNMAPDIVYTIQDWAERGDTVWARIDARGTQSGPFFGPPTGRPFQITVVDIVRVAADRIVEHWGVPDRFALLAQSGALERLKAGGPS